MHILHCCGAAKTLLQTARQDYVGTRVAREFSLSIKRLTTMFLTHIVRIYQQWRRYNQNLRELSRLGDRELADIGISRSDIPRVALENSER